MNSVYICIVKVDSTLQNSPMIQAWWNWSWSLSLSLSLSLSISSNEWTNDDHKYNDIRSARASTLYDIKKHLGYWIVVTITDKMLQEICPAIYNCNIRIGHSFFTFDDTTLERRISHFLLANTCKVSMENQNEAFSSVQMCRDLRLALSTSYVGSLPMALCLVVIIRLQVPS